MAADQPYVYYPDEWAFAKPAMQILVSGDPNPHVFIYPTLLTYAETGVAALVHAATDASLDAGLPPFQVGGMRNMSVSDFLPSQYPYVMWGRMLVGIFGVLTVVLVGLGGRVAINRRLQDVEAQDATPREGTLEGEASAPAPRSADTRPAAGAAGTGTSWLAGITGAAFMALAVLPLVFSRLLTTDVPSAFFAAATLVASLAARARPSDRKSDLLLMAAGLCTGLAASTKYNAIVVAIVPAIGYLTRAGSLRTLPAFLVASVRSRTPYLVVLAAVAGFVLATPMVLFDFQSVVGGIRETILLYNVLGHVGAEGNAAGFYVNYLWTVGFGPVLCVLSVAGIAWAIIRHRATDLALVVFPLLYFVLVSLPLVRYERNLLPLVPFVALLAGRFVADTLSALRVRLARRSPIAGVATVALLLAALAVQPVAAAAGNVRTASLPDTRSIALAWVDAHLPAGSTIVREAYTPQVSPSRYRVGYTLSLACQGTAGLPPGRTAGLHLRGHVISTPTDS